jgi:protein-disulfide isomerase
MDEPNITPPVSEEENTFQFRVKRSHFYAMAVVLAFLLGLTFGYIFWGRNEGAQVVVAAPQESNQTTNDQGAVSPAETRRYEFAIPETAATLGAPDAPIIFIEFSDFECPYCKRYNQDIFPLLMDAYSDKIYYAYVDFPLTSIHPNAFPAAEAAHCAGEQDSYWEFRDALFGASQGLGEEAYLAYAEELEMDLEAFSECVEEERYSYAVQSNFDAAYNRGVNSTPTFLINGIPMFGAQPFEIFADLIDSELEGTN